MKTIYFVYRRYDKRGNLLYVGCTRFPELRFKQHKAEGKWAFSVEKTTMESFPSKRDAFLAERKAIANESPKFNVSMRIDLEAKKKHYEILRKNGLTLEAIGKLEHPKISRQRVFQILNDEWIIK